MPPKKQPDAQPMTEIMELEPNLGGRPSSYLPEYTPITMKLCELGAIDVEIAQFFGVTQRTLNRWKSTIPEFAEALKRGKDPADDRIENSLYHKAQDREVEEEQAIKLKTVTYGENGKRLKEEERVEVVTVKRFIPGDTTAMIFWLKNRRSKEWRDVHKHEHGAAGAWDHLDNDQLWKFIVEETVDMTHNALPAPQPEGQSNGNRNRRNSSSKERKSGAGALRKTEAQRLEHSEGR